MPGTTVMVSLKVKDNYTGTTAGYHFKQIYLAGTLLWEDDVAGDEGGWLSVNVTATPPSGSQNFYLQVYSIRSFTNFGVTVYWDDVIIRKYSSPEPTISVGTEETVLQPKTIFYIQNQTGNIGIGTTTPTTKLQIEGCPPTNACLIVGQGSGKIDVGTVDPIYTINGKKYATYMPSMVGVKEEVSGVLKLKNINGKYKTIIDFSNLQEGSDLWLFSKVINIKGLSYIDENGKIYQITPQEIFNNLSILITPSFKGKVWYEKDQENLTITIYGEPVDNSMTELEISYRLTGPRFDFKKWSNFFNSISEGFNLDKLLK